MISKFVNIKIRAKSIRIAEKFVSPTGIKNRLGENLKRNELFRYQIFRGRVREEFSDDKLQAAEERITGNLKAGLMYLFSYLIIYLSDNGKYMTQMYKIKALRNMRFAENYSRWSSDLENVKYYKLKYAAQLGEDAERVAFNYYENEQYKNNGAYYGIIKRRELNWKPSEWPQY